MNPSILILISTLLLCSCGGDSSPAHGYAGSSAHVAKSLDPVDYGAVRDGTTDDQAAIQSAIDAAIASGADVELAGGTFVIGSPLVLSGKTTLWLHGKLKLAPGFTGSEAISITGDHVSLMGNGVLDFNGAAIEQGISAVAATRIQRPRISGLRFANFNPSFTASDAKGVIAFQFCDQPDVNGVYMSNCGGAGIYWSNCRRGYIYNTVIDAPGFLGITLGACMDCRVSGCTVTDAGQFCFKSGFGTTSHAISSDEAPAALAITVAADAASRRQFLPGHFLYVLESAPTAVYDAQILSIDDCGTFLRLRLSGLQAAPTAGASLLIANSGMTFTYNTANGSGENAWDCNLERNLVIHANTVTRAGLYDAVVGSSYVGVCGGIWVGADPFAGFTNLHCRGISITGNVVQRAKGSGILVWSCSGSAVIANNIIDDIDRGNETGAPSVPTYGGIALNNLTYVRCDGGTISGNTIRSLEGNAIQVGYGLGITVSNNTCITPAGIRFTDMVGNVVVSGNNVRVSRSGSSALALVKAGVSCYGALFVGNDLDQSASTGNAILIQDSTAQHIRIGHNVLTTGGGASLSADCPLLP